MWFIFNINADLSRINAMVLFIKLLLWLRSVYISYRFSCCYSNCGVL